MAGQAAVLCVVVHYHEISLKGGNRPLFLRRLARNLLQATAGCGVRGVRRLPGRLVLDLQPDADLPRIRERVATVFGIAYFALGLSLPPDWPAVQAAVLQLLEGRSFESFRITARRTFKVFPMPSDQVNRELGDLVLRHFPTRVNLTEPALTVRVDLLPGEALVFVDRVAGPGGLPVGVSGRVAALLSGGIDSPVAACRLQKRGCEVEFVHFHSVPYLSDTSQRKARTLVERLVRHQFTARLWLVPFGEIQREVVLGVPAPAPRRGLPALHGADHRGDRPEDRRPGPGHRREPGPGRVADAREHRADHGGRRDADPPAAHRDRQGGDHPRGPRDRDLRDLHRARPGLLHPLRAEAPRDARERRTPWRPPSCASTSPASWRWARRARSPETFRFPPVEAVAPVSAGS